MYSLLAATVLVSGLAAGNGASSGSPSATARVDFSGYWEGAWEACGAVHRRLILTGGKVCIFRDGWCMRGGLPSYRCSLVAEGPTTVRVSLDGKVFRGAYRIKGHEVRIYLNNGSEWALTRFDLRK